MPRFIVRHISMAVAVLGLLAMALPQVVNAKTYYVKYRAKVCSSVTHKCRYVIRYKYVTLARGTPKGVLSYKPAYNVMSVGTSRSGVMPSGAKAVCADGHYVFSSATTAGCAGHHGVAWKF